MENGKLRNIPYSAEAENFILGSLLIDQRLALEYCSRLDVQDFYVQENKKIFTAIQNLYQSHVKIEYLSVVEELKRMNEFDAIGKDYLLDLMDILPTIVNAESYIEIILQKSLERELYFAISTISQDILTGQTEFEALLANTERIVFQIVNKRKTTPFVKIDEATEKVMYIVEENRNKQGKGVIGLDTGFKKLNEYTLGFQKGELIILAARPGIGKSAFALNVAAYACLESKAHVAFFSLEMSVDQLVMRLLSLRSNVQLQKIRSGNMTPTEMTRVLAAKARLDDSNLYIDEGINGNLEDVKVKCRKLKREGKLDLIIIDYLQLLSLTAGQDKLSIYERVTKLSRGLKILARELDVPIMALSQLSRAIEQRKEEEQIPLLSDLRESGSIEQDADIVIFLHRRMTKKEELEQKTSNRSRKTDIFISKNRQGEVGSFELVFRGDCSSFTEME
ncbi:MAG TPA: replicative DNA helicase [Bacilli bacterium]|jgi:replicative DNA helicase|nr:replicative DNA helicase [Bacilli bacterium]NLT01965.1 replicative DNA helicase [Acholeplasmataceae bacterium]HNZ77843.1 replicative DNA helicase [Bacilli bacterium]HOD60888.1 replicative DNA helicase [Bacilli bacterium]HOE06856.1 replicative DNA helicase [Bacilli bacterium]